MQADYYPWRDAPVDGCQLARQKFALRRVRGEVVLARERDNGDAADGKGVPEYAVSVARRPESLLRAHAALAEGIDVAVPPRGSPHGGYAGRVIGGRETIIVLVAAAGVKKR